MQLMNEVLKPLIGKPMVVYFNGILIYNKDTTEYLQYIHEVFQL